MLQNWWSVLTTGGPTGNGLPVRPVSEVRPEKLPVRPLARTGRSDWCSWGPVRLAWSDRSDRFLGLRTDLAAGGMNFFDSRRFLRSKCTKITGVVDQHISNTSIGSQLAKHIKNFRSVLGFPIWGKTQEHKNKWNLINRSYRGNQEL